MKRIHLPVVLALAGILAISCASRKRNYDVDKALSNQKKALAKAEKQMKKEQEAAKKKSSSSRGESSW